MRRIVPLLLVGAGLLAACNDQGPDERMPTTPVQRAISQGSGFTFLASLVSNPTPTGIFNPRLAPIVEICRLTTYNGTCTSAPVFRFNTTTPGPFGELVRLNTSKNYYFVEWNTALNNIPNNAVYRISVMPEANSPTPLGFVDIVVSSFNGVLQAAPSQQTVGVRRGTELPIRFHIAEGALCAPGAAGCFEASFTSTTDKTFVNPDSSAGVDIDPGAIPQGQAVNLVIERYTGTERCLPMEVLQYEGCYRIFTVPHVTLQNTAQVNVCVEPIAGDFVNELELWKWSEDPQNPQLQKVADPLKALFLSCSNFQVASADISGRWQGFASAAGKVLKPFASLFGAKPLYAASASMAIGPKPFGGTLGDFSRLGLIRPITLTIQSGDGQTAKPGQTVPNAPTVKVMSTVTQLAAAGVEVQFAVKSGNGVTVPTTAFTDAGGLASTQWTLGTAGNQTLQATVLSDAGFPNQPTATPTTQTRVDSVTFVALATQYDVFFRQPLGTSTGGTANWVSTLAPSIEICQIANGQCVATIATVIVNEVSFARRVYEGDWNVPSLDTSLLYHVRILVNGVEIGGTNFQAVTGQPGLGQVKIGAPLKISFTVENKP